MTANTVADHVRIVDQVMGRLTLDEKVGQCLTQSWRGGIITPSVVELIEKLHVGGLRIEPYATEAASRAYYGQKADTQNFDRPADYTRIAETYWRVKAPSFNISPEQYAQRLNKLKDIAMNRHSGLPLHICTDVEGDFSHDYSFGGINLFPANMGLRAGGEPELAYRVGHAVARQLAAIGIQMLHSPVLDVNINPRNPEINIRAFSDDPDVFCRYAVQYMRGLEDGGLIATAKHYPGRGDSDVDAHHQLPVVRADRARLDRVELAPYRACIAAGLRAIMVSHNAFTALDEADIPASLSRRMITDLLRNELGFDGVITTDAIGMGAIAQRWGIPTACAMALKAGCDLVLLKFDDELRSQAFYEVRRWVLDKRLPEAELDEHVRRVLMMKARQGLFDDGGKVDADAAGAPIADPAIRRLSVEAAQQATLMPVNHNNLLPLKPTTRALVIEQLIIPEFVPNNEHHHTHSFTEAMLEHSMRIVPMDSDFSANQEETQLAVALAANVDVIVLTNYYWRIIPKNQMELISALRRTGKPIIVVTNNPYPMGSSPDADAVVCTFSCTPQSLKAAAAIIYGKLQPRGKWPLEHTQFVTNVGAAQ